MKSIRTEGPQRIVCLTDETTEILYLLKEDEAAALHEVEAQLPETYH